MDGHCCSLLNTFFLQEFEKAGVDLNRPMVASCARGITACTLALGAAILGKEVPVYDVSSIYGHVWSRDPSVRCEFIVSCVCTMQTTLT